MKLPHTRMVAKTSDFIQESNRNNPSNTKNLITAVVATVL